jgi:hypothetical protein
MAIIVNDRDVLLQSAVRYVPAFDVTGFAYALENFGITLSWDTDPQKNLRSYEIRSGGTDWNSAAFVVEVKSTKYSAKPASSGNITYRIKAIDTSGNYSTNATSVTVVVTIPSAVSPSASIAGENAIVTWTPVTGSFSIDHYEVRQGASWASGTVLELPYSTAFTEKVSYSGTRTYWVAAVDVAGNVGTPASTTITITAPSAPSVTSQVIDNNVLLYWTDSKQTLPIESYEIRRGATYAGATVVGTKQGLFTVLFETSAGTYTYWVTGIDTAGNYGTPTGLAVPVNQPPDFVFRNSFNSTFGGTLSNAIVDNGGVVMPVNTTETWAQHFTNNSWSTPQDQITAGYPIYIEPANSPGYYEEVFDCGTVLGSNKVTLSYTGTVIAGSPAITTIISVSATGLGGSYTDYPGVSSVYASGFRYIKIRITVTGGTSDLYKLTSLNPFVNSKLINDGGTVSAVSTDVGGTAVTFNVPFVAVTTITVTALTTSPVYAVYDFSGVPYPTSFKVLLFNSSGTRISGSVSWAAKGN